MVSRDRSSTLGLASRYALDAERVDERGRKALHRFVGGTENVAPEHLKRVLDSHPEAAALPDKDGWLPLNHYCRGLSGDLEAELAEDDVERHLKSLKAKRGTSSRSKKTNKLRQQKEEEAVHFFQGAQSMTQVRREYKALLLKYHPDKNIGKEEEAARLMHIVQEAYLEACEKFHEAHPVEAAVKTGDPSRFIDALKTAEAFDFVDSKGNNLVHLACQHLTTKHDTSLKAEQLETIIQLSGGKVKLFEPNADGDLPLHVLLCCHRNPHELDSLIHILLSLADDLTDDEEQQTKEQHQEERTISTTNADGRLPLHVACRCQRFIGQKRCLPALRRLVDAYPDGVRSKDAYDWTPLHLFAQFQLDPITSAFEILLAGHDEVVAWTTCVDRDTPVHLACYANRRRIAETSLDFFKALAQRAPEAAVSSCREHRKPWNHLPPKDTRYTRACAALLEPWLTTASIDALKIWRDPKSDASLLHLLCSQEAAALPSSLVESIAIKLIESQEMSIDKYLCTPLHKLCTLSHDVEHQHLLFNLLAPHLAKDARGHTPLHAAVGVTPSEESVAWLLEAEPDAASIPTNDGEFPVHLACSACVTEICPEVPRVLKLLTQSAPSVAARRDGLGKFAWDYLPKNDERYEACLQLLLGQLLTEIQEETQNESELVLHLVSANHVSWVAKALKARPKEVFAKDSAGNTPLHLFAQHQKLQDEMHDQALNALYLLLKTNEDAVIVQNKAGYTPLHLLCLHQKPAPAPAVLTAFLAARPHAASIRCHKGDTPISCLCRANCERIHTSLPANLKALLEAANFEHCLAFEDSEFESILSPRKPNATTAFNFDLLLPCDRGLRPWEHLPVSEDSLYAESCAVLMHDLIAYELSTSSEKSKLDRQHSTALHLLCSRAGRCMRSSRLPSLERCRASIESFLKIVDKNGATPLHIACQSFVLLGTDSEHELEFLERLIELSAEQLQNSSGWTPLHIFVQKYSQYLCFDDEALDMIMRTSLLRLFRKLVKKAPSAISLTTSSGDTVLHLVCHACRKTIGKQCGAVLTELADAAPAEFGIAARRKGKAHRIPIDWLPSHDPLFSECDEILTNRASRCLELLLEQHAPGAGHAIPGSGELALHQLCTVTPPVATVAMLDALLRAHPEAARTPRDSDAATPLHLLCTALISCELTSAQRKSAPQLLHRLLAAAPDAAFALDLSGHKPDQILNNSLMDRDLLDECLAVFATAHAMSVSNLSSARIIDTDTPDTSTSPRLAVAEEMIRIPASVDPDLSNAKEKLKDKAPVVAPEAPFSLVLSESNKSEPPRKEGSSTVNTEVSWQPASRNFIASSNYISTKSLLSRRATRPSSPVVGRARATSSSPLLLRRHFSKQHYRNLEASSVTTTSASMPPSPSQSTTATTRGEGGLFSSSESGEVEERE